MEIAIDEVFGPVMVLLPFKSEEEVIKRANDTMYGLAAGLHTNSLQRAHRVSHQLAAGNVFVNTYNMQQPFIPFGGYKNSGHGRENSEECLKEHAQIKAVYLNVGGDIP
ncbi:UNVERIFIED_CONTAM: Aldehyde dehydrogenase family 9 member A1, partial [Eudyptes robustus]